MQSGRSSDLNNYHDALTTEAAIATVIASYIAPEEMQSGPVRRLSRAEEAQEQ